jgi:hypothetical protein
MTKMKLNTAPCAGVSLACLLVALAIAWPAFGQGTFKLTQTEMASDNRLTEVVGYGLQLSPKAPPSAKLPRGLSQETQYLRTMLHGVWVRMLLDPKKPAKLYVDTDSDSDYAEETPLTGSPGEEGRFISFPRVRVAGRAGGEKATGRFAVRAVIAEGVLQYAYIVPTDACTGRATLGGSEYAVAVVDANLNGLFNDALGPAARFGPDFLAVDLDGDGTCKTSGEIQPLAEVVGVGSGFYAVEVAADGSSITFRQPKLALGALRATGVETPLWVSSRTLRACLSPGSRRPDGTWPLPVGSYTIETLRISRQDDEGTFWWLQRGSKRVSFTIAEGKTTDVKLGPPLILKTSVGQKDRTVEIEPKLFGQGGEEYRLNITKGSDQLPEPRYRILDERGNQLAAGKFKYG